MKSIKSLFPLPLLLPFIFFAITSCNNNNTNAGIKTVSDTLKSAEVANPYLTLDQSPMDMSYYPADYPVLRMNGTDSATLVARVIYSRPQKKGRLVFGASPKSLREYGKEWRLGANEATEIEFFKDVVINGQKIIKGRYIIYCIPFEEKWTIILNTNLFAWGLHMDKTKDIFTVDIPTELQSPSLEDFTMIFEKASYGSDLIIAWDNVKVVMRIRTS